MTRRVAVCASAATLALASVTAIAVTKTKVPPAVEYRVLVTNKTSTMQKEMQEAADAGFEYRGQTVFKSAFGGKEVAAIFERGPNHERVKHEYHLLATSRTSTMQKELTEAGDRPVE